MSGSKIIPFFGIQRQYKNLRNELLDITDRVYTSGQVLDGNYTKYFELEISERCDRAYAVAMGSCTQALIFANAFGAKKTNKVMIPAISFAATLNSVIMGGCEPVFCDTDDAGLIDLASVDFAIAGAGVSAINYVNLWGHTINWDKFRIHTEFFNQDLFIIEDAAQSFGASYKEIPSGKMGTVSCLSFDPTKNLNNYGSGGMLLTDDVDIYNAAVNFRDNGKMDGHHDIGTNSKMSEADCAQMLVKLRHFDAWQTRRQQIADYYASNLYSYVDCVLPKPDVTSAWSKFVIRLTHRHGLRTHLSNNGVETKIHYDKILTELPIGYEYTDYINESFREAHAFTRECLSLPIYPELTDAEVEHIVKCTLDYLR